MIEELTPQVAAAVAFVVVALTVLLGSTLALAVLVVYRRNVVRAMAQSGGGRAAADPGDGAHVASGRVPEPAATAEPLFERAEHAGRRSAAVDAAAGAAFAVVVAIAAWATVPALHTGPRSLLAFWLFAWPIVPALILTAPPRRLFRAGAVLVYAAALIAAQLVDALFDLAVDDAQARPYLARLTPPQIVLAWLAVDGVPTALLAVFANRRMRAIGPLALGFAASVAAGFSIGGLLLLNNGTKPVAAIVEATHLDVGAVLGAAALGLVAVSAVVGWLAIGRIRAAWLAGRTNDRALTLDALWSLFASWYATLLAFAGFEAVLAVALALVVRKGVAVALRRRRPPAGSSSSSRGLVFLRVFALGPRSDRLLDAVARSWRLIGCVDLITGPDVALSTAQPHQLLDFLSGRLATHFIADARGVEVQVRRRVTRPDRDGLHRINTFFCRADAWQRLLPFLAGGGDAVLIDLRGFGPTHAGCVHELNHLVARVSLLRFVVVVDSGTDEAFLEQTLRGAFAAMPADSPNRGAAIDAVRRHRLGAGNASRRELLRRLACAAEPVV